MENRIPIQLYPEFKQFLADKGWNPIRRHTNREICRMIKGGVDYPIIVIKEVGTGGYYTVANGAEQHKNFKKITPNRS